MWERHRVRSDEMLARNQCFLIQRDAQGTECFGSAGLVPLCVDSGLG